MSLILSAFVFYAFLAYCFWRILLRVGYPPWAAFLSFVPFLGQAILVAWLAFGRWPLLEYVETWREWERSDQ
jgi:hypothetical protein